MPTPTRATSRTRRLLTGLAALIGLAAIVIAIPVVLLAAWKQLGPPLPNLHDLTAPDDGTVFIRVLCLVGWIGWATLTWTILAEILAVWRGWRLPALAWQQRIVAGMVASVSLMMTSPAIASTGAAPVDPAAFQRPAAVATTATADLPTAAHPSAAAAAYLIHPVVRGEQLSQLAQRYYGDRFQWERIANANYGIAQPDGRSLQPGQTRIYPGWQLRIPTSGLLPDQSRAGNTPVLRPVADVTSTAHLVYTVKHGDWLWFISARFLGDPDRYPEIAALNPGLITAHTGPHGPSHIEAGWKLILPSDAYDRGLHTHASGTVHQTDPTGPATPHHPKPGPTKPPVTATPAPTATVTPTPSASTRPTPSATSTPAAIATASPTATAAAPTTHPTPTTTTTASQSHDPDSDDELAIIGTFAGTGLLAALALIGVRRARRRQRQHRRPQRRLPHPRGGTTETALLVAQRPLDVDRLDATLRTLGDQLADRPHELRPDTLAVTVDLDAVTLHLSHAAPDAPAPWHADGTTWTLPATAPQPNSDGQVAPLPTLATVGASDHHHLLLDLERLGNVVLDGDPARTGGLLRYIAAELACNTWSDDVELILAGFDHTEAELLTALSPDRVHAVASVADAANRLRRRVATATTTLRHVGATDALAGRIDDLAGDAWMPQVLLVADTDDAGRKALQPLIADIAAAGRCAVATVLNATAVLESSGPAQRLTIRDDGQLSIDLDGHFATIQAAALPLVELEPLAEIMRSAREAADEPVPPAAESEEWAAGTDAAGGVLGLFGRPDPDPTGPEPTEPIAKVVDLDPWREQAHDEQVIKPAADGTSAVSASALLGSRRPVTAAIRQGRQLNDRHLDRDLDAWHRQDPNLVRVGVLGTVTVYAPGEEPAERRLFLAEIIVYLAQRGQRGAAGQQLSHALWPNGNAKEASRRVAITRARRWLGDTPTGEPWLPDMGADRTYRLANGYLLDWHLFRRLRTRGEAHGPAGVRDLRAALDLVRGMPLDGADRSYAANSRNPYPWLPESEIYPGHISTAISDTAHQLAELHLQAGDTAGARWAVDRGWLADPYRGDDNLWLDAMLAEHLDGHSARVRELFGQLIAARELEVPEDLSKTTYLWLREHLPDLL